MKDSDLKNEIALINPNVTILGEYEKSNVKVLCSCNICCNTWYVTPSHLKQGRGCPVCARKNGTRKRTKTHTEFIEKVKEASPNINVLSLYQNAHSKINCKCEICGHEWYGRADHLQNGIGCPNCAGNAKKTSAVFVKEMETVNPTIEIKGEYKSADEKVLCKCTLCGNEWRVAPNTLLSGVGCPQCARRNKTSFAEQAIFFYVSQYFDDTVNRHIEEGVEFDIFVKSRNIAIEYDGLYWHKRRIKHDNEKDKFCVEHNIQLIRIREEELEKTNYAYNIFRKDNTGESLKMCIEQILSFLKVKEYNVNIEEDKLKILGKYYSIIKNSSLQNKNIELVKEWNFEKNLPITPDMVYSSSSEKFWWKCSTCGYEWQASLDHRTNGRGCPCCSKKKMRDRMLKKHEDFIREIEEKNIGIEILGEYEGSRILIRCRCKACFENFSLTPHDILAGRNCPKCTKKETLKKITKSHELFMCQLEKINSNIVILEKYNGARSAIQCQCKKCGYIWRSTPDRLLKGAGCPKCAGNARISHEEFVEIVKSVNDKIEIIEKYTNSQNKVSYRCLQCDYIGEMRAAHLKKGHGCPLCSRRRN